MIETKKQTIFDYIERNDLGQCSDSEVARKIYKDLDLGYNNLNSLRRYISKIRSQTTTTTTNQYEKPQQHFNAIGDNGRMMDIDAYCEHYNLPRKDIKSYKLVSHTAVPYYNIAFFESVEEYGINTQEAKEIINEGIKSFNYKPKLKEGNRIGVIKISDLHFGAYVNDLLKTKKFSINILAELLKETADQINRNKYAEVHVHILGDLIESFTGLNHKNSWKGLDKGMIGAEAVKLCVSILHKDFLRKINNLKTIKIIAGNHDRVTSDNTEDVKGDAANLISWGLSLIGYEVEFHPLVIKHVVDGICHLLFHGDKGISKKSTQQICWDYGEQGMFNLVCEGHLHTQIEKLSSKQREAFNVIKDDGIDHLRMICRSFFTGNYYSESLGYYSLSGFHIIENNGYNHPNINNYILR